MKLLYLLPFFLIILSFVIKKTYDIIYTYKNRHNGWGNDWDRICENTVILFIITVTVGGILLFVFSN